MPITEMWMKAAILPFPKKADLGSVSNYRSITSGLKYARGWFLIGSILILIQS